MDWRQPMFFAGPKILTAATLVLLLCWPDVVRGSAPAAYWVAFGVTCAGLVTLFLLSRGTYTDEVTVVGVLAQAALLIGNYGAIYAAFGVIDTQTVAANTSSLATAMYFSIVTWTTLGYGDVQPDPALRLLAASEALVGYVYLGLLVGKATTLLRSKAI
jgi:hypothetical protein